ncbi:ferrochelatase [Streptomyces sp. I05A-00742]|uniref:ferrochelatase n=1 Tax=Streptomyces sp. I05A-00742 TaxID=2732853 RepID=UPI0014892038|nr:ferrochelatase [Streptomyces sp. I05A-00742]
MEHENPSPTGVVLMNLGGPRTLPEVGPFLRALFNDREIIQLPAQSALGPLIARLRTPRLQKTYAAIGGGSPLYDWTVRQGEGLVKRLDVLSPETAPHRPYLAFRYTEPSSGQALRQMAADGVRRAVAFPQYPQYSCSTTGSSLHDLWATARRLRLDGAFRWSVVDRWSTHPAYVQAMAAKVREGLADFPESERDNVVVLFSAHSLPQRVINKGDPYLQEVAGTVRDVMRELGDNHEYALCFQADVGPVAWQGPNTESVIRALGKQGRRNILIVGIIFTTDHLDTLSEIDIEFAEAAEEAGVTTFRRAPAPNDDPLFLDAMAQVVADHLSAGTACGPHFALRCAGCVDPACREILNPAHAYPQRPPDAPR